MNRLDKEVVVVNWRMLVSSLIFVVVTIVKLLFPEQTEAIRKQTVSLIDMDMDYRPFVTEVGSILTKDSVYEVMGVTEIQKSVITPIDLLQSSESMVHDNIHQTDESSIASKIESFLLSQEAYSEYEIPVNVFYGCIEPSFSFVSPVKGVCASGFGYRVHPIDGVVSFHYGTDYDVNEGTHIQAFADGMVSAVGEEAGYGKYVCIDHEDGWRSLYAHCSDVKVTSGQRIQRGEVIGESGATGRVTGPHLHFELMHDGIYTNPEFYLA